MSNTRKIPNKETIKVIREAEIGINMEETTLGAIIDEYQQCGEKYKKELIEVLKRKGIET
jgi:hypothetical protein